MDVCPPWAVATCSPGFIEAHKVKDGELLWKSAVPMPPNNAPAIGKLPGHAELSIVQPGGYQGAKGGPTGVWAYDATTGKMQWSFNGPAQKEDHQAAELEGRLERFLAGASDSY